MYGKMTMQAFQNTMMQRTIVKGSCQTGADVSMTHMDRSATAKKW
jgi:hypothetical protein